MGFFRSSESKSSKSKSRFSFRRHSDDASDVIRTKPVPAPLPPQTRKQHSSSQPMQASGSASSRPPAHPQPVLTATFVSSASTSASSSVTSPTALQRTAQTDSEEEKKKTTTSKRPSDSLVSSTDTDDSEFLLHTPRDSLSTPRGSFDFPTEHSTSANRTNFSSSASAKTTEKVQHTPMSPSPSRDSGLLSRSDSQNSQSGLNSRGQRHSLVGYRQLHCSMSYKNRMATGGDRDESMSMGRTSFSSSRRSESGRMSSHSATSIGSYPHSGSNSSLGHIDELTPAAASSASQQAVSSTSKKSRSTTSSVDAADASSSSLLNGRMSEVRMTEANVAALQTRRAFQQMVLAIEDDDSDYDSDSDNYMPRRSRDSFVGSGGIVQVGADDYRKFQFRLRQLEDMCHDQARKQAVMEETIENEVQTRTKKVVEAMEKKIAIYKQVKDAEVEREIQRRVSEGPGRFSSGRDSVYGAPLPPQHPSLSSSPVMVDSRLSTGKPLEKIFHPRRTRKRLELLREQEERQKREMEQFREFIRSTEMRSTMALPGSNFNGRETTMGSHGEEASARASIKALRDPHITEDLLAASQSELIEMICVLRKHVSVQEGQLDEAKKLISTAIEAREEAEEMAKEAVELTMDLDSRLERASQEMVLIKDELRRSSEFSLRSSYLMGPTGDSSLGSSFRGVSSSTNSNLPRTASFPR